MCVGEKPRAERRPVTDISKLWVLHGRFYDLQPFMARHPGGAYNLLLGRGRDCTELFESVHSLSDVNMSAILNKYEVSVEPQILKEQAHKVNITLNEEGTAPVDLFSWKKEGLYKTIVQRVKAKVFSEDANYKATKFVAAKLAVMAVLYVMTWYFAVTTGNLWWAVCSGALTEMLGFCLMHDASHGAVSKNWRLNYGGTLWSSWMFWNHWLWLQHHCYGHHSYSGIYRKDPDVVNSKLFIRKDKAMKMTVFNKFQHWIAFPLMMMFPNQHIGQIIQYQLSRFRRRIFGLPTTACTPAMQMHNNVVMLLSFLFHIVAPFVFLPVGNALAILFVHYTLMGISYFFCVAPNHDQMEQHHAKLVTAGQQLDWGEHQVLNSGNHSTSTSLVDRAITQLWGSMNYQIEHHLFPSVSHVHMPRVAVIVRQTCAEFGVAYNGDHNWLGSMGSFWHACRELARP